MATATLIKTTAADGTAAAAPAKVEINKKVQAVRNTDGDWIEVPANRKDLHDTQAFAQNMTFFPPNPNGDLIRNNYDQMPPNGAEATVITGLAVCANVFAITSFAGGGNAANAISPNAIASLIARGVLIVESGGDRRHLVEQRLANFFDLSLAKIQIDGANTVLTLPTTLRMVPLKEAIYVPQGQNYKVRIQLPSGVGIPTAAAYVGSEQTPLEFIVQAEHRTGA